MLPGSSPHVARYQNNPIMWEKLKVLWVPITHRGSVQELGMVIASQEKPQIFEDSLYMTQSDTSKATP